MSLKRLLEPRGVAFVGATPDSQRYNGRVVQYCLATGYRGGVFPVNPKYKEVFGQRCYPTLAEIEAPIDVVVVLVGPSRVPDLLETCRVRDVSFAVALGDLVDPSAPDAAEQTIALKRQIANGAPRCVGPVCVGVIAPHADLAMTMSSGVLAGPVRKGGIGLISQSGGVLSSVLDRGYEFGAGFSAVISSGSELDLNLCDYVEYLIDDEATRCISIYAEKIIEPDRFFRAADRARAAGKPILLLKSGTSPVGARAALTHSGAIASDRAIEDAAFRRHGIIRVAHIDDLHMSAEALCRTQIDPDKGIAAVSQSGGYCALVADRLSEKDIPVAEPCADTVSRILAETPVPRVGNPHDSASGPPGNNAPNSRAALLAFQDDPGVGATLYAETMYMYQAEGHILQRDVARYGAKPHFVCWEGGAATRPVIASLRKEGVLAFDSLRAAAAAIDTLYRYGRIRAEKPLSIEASAHGLRGIELPAKGGILADAEAKRILRHFSVPLVPEVWVETPEAAVRASREIGFPLAVKGIVEGVAHKSEHGLVAINVQTVDELRARCAHMARSDIGLRGYLLQQMVQGVEFVVGVKNDPSLGSAVVLGLGGLFVEAYGAPVIEMAPIDTAAANRMIEAVDRKNILGGYRTGRTLDGDGLVRALMSVGHMAATLGSTLESVDLNPVIVGQKSTYAVDAVIAIRSAVTGKVSETRQG